MKIKTLAAMCKREGVFTLFDRKNAEGSVTEQWLGTWGAFYPLSGLPYLTEDNLVALFDITEKQRENITFKHEDMPEGYSFDDTDRGEVMLDREKMTLGYSGRIVRPLITRGGLEFINDDFYAPLSDVADMLEIFERRTQKGGVYFAAKTGLMIAGIFMPMNIIEERFVESLEAMAVKCRAALDVKIERERLKDEQGEQQTL